jgi:hypothetical protein
MPTRPHVLRDRVAHTPGQISERRRHAARTVRHELVDVSITEAARFHADATRREKGDVTGLMRLYALTSRLLLLNNRPVLVAAGELVRSIAEAFLAPNRSPRELRILGEEGKVNFLVEFSEACRRGLDL